MITKLRAELAPLEGAVRLGPLTRLGQALAERYWRGGPGQPSGLPHLNGAIEALQEAYGYMRADDGLRGQVAGMLGWNLAARHSLHPDAGQDRETGIRMLEEAIASPNLSELLRAMCRVQLGQLYFSQAVLILQAPGAAMNLVTGQVPPDVAADTDRAVDILRQVIADPPASAELVEAAEAMLAMAEVMQTMMRGTGGGFDVQRLMDGMAKLQNLQARFARSAGPGQSFSGTPTFLSFSDMQAAMSMSPLDRPVPVVRQQGAGEPVVVDAAPVDEPEPRPVVVPAPATPDRDELRRSLHDKLPGADGTEPGWARAAAMLLPTAPVPAVDVVDEVVALAMMIVDLADGDGEAVAVDRFVLAVALYLRDRVDDDPDHADRLAGAENLLAAVGAVPADHPAATTMLRALGAFLTEDQPLGGVLDTVADGFADRLDAAITAGVAKDAAELATLHALRCLCRAAGAVAELGRAAVPPDYPWQATLKAACRAVG
jgi:hypothetical protein